MFPLLRRFFTPAAEADARQKLDAARLIALEGVLGKSDGTLYRPTRPMRRMGCASVLRFRNYVNGVTYATSELIGNERQVPNRWGHYELMICTPDENSWAPQLICRLAPYTYENTLQPGDTMDLSDVGRTDTRFKALLFCRPDPPAESFNVFGTPAGLLLMIAITDSEFAACKSFGSGVVLRKLRDAEVYPFSDMKRASVL